tara:strand:- start:478 stop:867 length:390 start_codon:yes stop_codon:yes gene_type:complete
MSILDKAHVGGSVKINFELLGNRLDKETLEALKISSIATINDFRITDGKGIGVVLKLSNGKEQWFFENEIDLLDEDGNVIEKNDYSITNNNLVFEFLKRIKYENKNKISDLLNPVNFMIWLIVSIKDIF